MKQPNSWILLSGGIALLNVGLMVSGAHAPAWARWGPYAGAALLVALGVTSIGLAITSLLKKKPERPKFVPRRSRSK